MPGTRLNDSERALQRSWDANRFGQFLLLKSISVNAPNGSGLRGIKNLSVQFEYPITFFSGQNGCGKSTLLSLAALAFHGHPGHVPTSARSVAGEGPNRLGYYTFKDFFHRGPGDSNVTGVGVTWDFSDGNSIAISKQSDKWMRYERRPARPVEFLGLSRAVPAIELPSLRSQFGLSATPVSAPLSVESRQYLEQILSRPYPSAEVLSGSRYDIRRSGREGGYTSFNMGTGEDALIGLLARLAAVPAGSLVVIEEIETGLHPAAQRKLMRALIEIALSRRLQIIGSTHSHHVLDQLPRQARILLLREGESHRVVPSPSAQFALSEIADIAASELHILCEDEFAAGLIAQMLPKALRRRVSIKSCGSDSALAMQAQSYLRLEERARCLILWDGDVSDGAAANFIAEARRSYPHASAEHRLFWGRLPGDECPETWVLGVAKTTGIDQVRVALNFESNADASEALARCGLADPHDIPYELAQQVGLPEPVVANVLAGAVARAATNECLNLTNTVRDIIR